MKRYAFLPLLAAFLACPALGADPVHDADARAALALAAARPAQAPRPPQAPALTAGACVCEPPCGCGGACGCAAGRCSGDCGCDDYPAAYRRAVREGRDLVVWVDFRCPACEKETPGAVHCHVGSLRDGSYFAADAPRVVVARPDGAGGMDRLTALTGAMGPGRLRGAMDVTERGSRTTAPPPAFYPAPPPAFFGGGFGGGFAGGGGCASCGSGGGRRR